MRYFLYLLKSNTANKSYVGITNNLKRRLSEHNSGKHFYTKRYCPWKMIYNEEYDSLIEARAREKYLKSSSGRRFLKELFNNLNL
jgi:putative endonuclease